MKIVKAIILATIVYLVASTGILSDDPDVVDAALRLPQLGHWIAAGALSVIYYRLPTAIGGDNDGQPGGVRPKGHR